MAENFVTSFGFPSPRPVLGVPVWVVGWRRLWVDAATRDSSEIEVKTTELISPVILLLSSVAFA